jgi:hypothetical protein
MRNLLLTVAVLFMFFIAYNIDFIEHRRSHTRSNMRPTDNHTGWSKGGNTLGFSPLFIRLRNEL